MNGPPYRFILLAILFSNAALLRASSPPATGAIAAGNGFTLALKSDGTVWAWGNNSSGQLGLGPGTTTNQSGPAQVQATWLSNNNNITIVGIAAGAQHSLAVDSAGQVWAWGDDSWGQLGNGIIGSQGNQSKPGSVSGLSGVTVVSAGLDHSLALDSQGRVWAWGSNAYDQLGLGSNSSNGSYTTPQPVTALDGKTITAIAAGSEYSLAIDNQGGVWAWGSNIYGQLGNGNTQQQPTPVQVSAPSGVTFSAIAAGGSFSLAVDTKGEVWAWGENNVGQLGIGNTTNQSTPVQTFGLNNVTVTSVAAGSSHGLAMDNQGRVWAWGYNGDGELGNGNTTNEIVPVQVNNIGGAVAVTAGSSHSLILKNDGTVWTWGDNSSDEYGDGANAVHPTPVWVNNLANVTALASADSGYTLALKSDGTVWAWGYNSDGELGDGTTISHNVPTEVNGLSGLTGGVTAISTAYQHSLALDNQGNVWAWGYNGDSELGDGSSTSRSMPEKVISSINGSTDIVAISAGLDHSLALASDGTVWIFGTDYYYDKGTQDTWATPNQVAMPLPANVKIRAIAAGESFNLALDSQGNVWSWGYDGDGELGNGATTSNPTPKMISFPGQSNVTVVAISARDTNSLALDNNGNVWQWGSQSDGVSTWNFSSSSPQQVQAQNGSGFGGAALAIVAAGDSSMVLASNGTVYTWGANDAGQLGNNSTTDSSTPVQVVNLTGVTAVATGYGGNNAGYKLAAKSDGTIRGWGNSTSGAFDFTVPVPMEAAIRLIPESYDPNQNGMSNANPAWNYYSVSQNGLGDPNCSGLTVIEDYVMGLDPTQANSDALVDYYDGVLPNLTSLVTNGTPGPEGLVQVLVTNASTNAPLANAPVSFAVTTGASEISATENGGIESTQVNVTTNSSGIASAYVGFFKLAPDVLVATATSGGQTQTVSINIQMPNVVGPVPVAFPDLPNVVGPSPDPGPQSGWDTFTPPVTSDPPAAGTPAVAEWTRTGGPDDSLILTGDAFSNLVGTDTGSDTQFMVYGQNSASNAAQFTATVQRLDGMKAAITLPATLPADSMYLLWPENSAGYGVPVAVNRTEAWWIGPNQTNPGDTVSVYGRNLTHDGGTSQSWVYLQPTGSTPGQAQWMQLVAPSSSNPDPVNPYQVQFTVPANITVPPNTVYTYQVWIHNGHGGSYGWSGPLALNVVAPFTWDSDDGPGGTFDSGSPATFNVQNPKYGATGNGMTDDSAAIYAAYIDAKNYRGNGPNYGHPTIYFPPGTYMMSYGIGLEQDIRYLGAGENLTTLVCNANFTQPLNGYATYKQGILTADGGPVSNVEIRDLTLEANGNFDGPNDGNHFVDQFYQGMDVCVTNVRVDAHVLPVDTIEGAVLFANTQRLTFTNCEFDSPGDGGVLLWGDTGVSLNGCTFKELDNAGGAIDLLESSNVSITNCTAQDYDSNTQYMRGLGRILVSRNGDGSQSNVYFGDNTSSNLGPVGTDTTNTNSGEQVLCEGDYSVIQSVNPLNATSTTFTISNPATDYSNANLMAVINNGRGLGQYRPVTFDNTTNTFTVSPPWNVVPDSNSNVLLEDVTSRWVVYHNSLQGKTEYDTTYTGIGGIVPDGGCFEWIGDSNTFDQMRGALSIGGQNQSPTTWNAAGAVDPVFFNYYANNTIENCYEGIGIGDGASSNPNAGIGSIGNIIRRNKACNITKEGAYEFADATAVVPLDMVVFEHNTFKNLPYGFNFPGNTEFTLLSGYANQNAPSENTVLYKNIFCLGSASSAGSFGANFGTNTQSPVLNGNTWTGFATTYAGAVPGGIMDLPSQFVDMPLASSGGVQTATVTIEDVGTAPLAWTATSDSSWLTLSSYGETAGGEDSPSQIQIICDPTGLAPGTYVGTITIDNASGPETMAVDFTVPSPVSTLPRLEGSNGFQKK